MATARNEVSQKVKFDYSEYSASYRKMVAENASGSNSITKDMQRAGTAFEDYSKAVKKGGNDVSGVLGTLKDAFSGAVGKSFGLGAAIGIMNQVVAGAANQLGKSADLALNFGKSLSNLAARADISSDKISQVRKSLLDLSNTGANMEALPDALNLVYGANGKNIDKGLSVMPEIAKVSGMTGMSPDKVAQFVVDRLKGENRSIDPSNVDRLLQSAMVATRQGGFNNIGEAMESMSAIDAGAKKRLGISDRQAAALTSSASQVGQTKERTVGAIRAMTDLEDEGFAGNAVIRGFFGGRGKRKGEQFQFSDYEAMAGDYQKKIKSGNWNESKIISMMQGMGLSKDESEGLNAYFRDFQSKAKPAYQAAMGDEKSVNQMFDQSTNNWSDRWKRFKNNATVAPIQFVDNLPTKGSKSDTAAEAMIEQAKQVKSNAPSWNDWKAAFGFGASGAHATAKGPAHGSAVTDAHGSNAPAHPAAMKKEELVDAVAAGVAKGMSQVKVGVTVDSKDAGLIAKPKSTDKSTSAKGF